MRRTSQLIARTVLNTSRSSSTRLRPPSLARTKSPKENNVNSSQPDRPSSRVHKRLASSQPVVEDQQLESVLAASDSPPESIPPSDQTPEKPQRRQRTSATPSPPPPPPPKDSDERPQLPPGLDILWLPDTPTNSNALPPPELFEDALINLHIALHPQTQHRAAYSSPAGPPAEPTLALYCPVEGGEYVLDDTVRELARRTGAEVLVIDAVHIAAGEWGHFGKAANAIKLPRNPLHYHPIPHPPALPRAAIEEEEDSDQAASAPAGISQMTLHVLAPVAASRGRPASVFAPPRSTPTPSRIKAFFDELINMPSPSLSSDPSIPQRIRPRLIYIRDFPTIASTAPTWYPHLLSAVRARRTGPIARPSSPVACPMAIVCGVTPPLVGPSSVFASVPSFFPISAAAQIPPNSNSNVPPPNSRQRHTARPNPGASSSIPHTTTPHTPSSSEWGEDDFATRSRERRLRARLRRWESHGDAALLEDVPRLFASSAGYSPFGNGGVFGAPQAASLPAPAFGSTDFDAPRPPILLLGSSSPLFDMMGGGQGDSEDPSAMSASGRFFRASVILPSARDQGAERMCRMTRRREVNELAMRLGVGGIGGVLETGAKGIADEDAVDEETEHVEKATESTYGELESDAEIVGSSADVEHELESHSHSPTGSQYPEDHEMWEDWSTRIEPWASVRQIADRAVGSVVSSAILSPVASSSAISRVGSTSLEPTSVPWSAIHRAWAAQRSSRDLRRVWSKDARVRVPRENQADDVTEDELDPFDLEDGDEYGHLDEVVEKLKQDPDLDSHEKRLLGCIVDPATLSTTFSQVHLPLHTIDSVRTLVSLPLLYPLAFQTGILKEHAMTGCLLFGPPGTGKTLLVRALAKEAGCRMLMISPSDVMDMYVGEGEKLVRAVFSLARRLSPCVVFLDEIDALFGARSSARESGGAMAHRGVITEFMQEMDGLKSQTGMDERVIVIGATNRPFDLDDAVLRRLPRRLLVDLPGEKEREGILNILLRDETLASDVDVKALSNQTESFSGSDLKHLCVSAALDAVKEGVSVPWKSTSEASPNSTTNSAEAPTSDSPETYSRTVHPRHFAKALKEITPSNSESLGSLADLRKWNEQFGEGRKEKKRIQVWGKGKFGFIDTSAGVGQDEGRVADPRAMARRTSSIDE